MLHAKAWRLGFLDWKFRPIQKRLKKAFESCKTFLFVSLIARQTGKSFHWFSICLEIALKKPNARIRYGTAFHEDLTEFIIPVANTILEDCPADLKPKFHKQGSKFVFKNGSEIKLVGLDINPDGIRGNALDLVVIDEAGFVTKLSYVFSIIIAMLRHRPALRVVMSSSAPETPDHDFKDFYFRALNEGSSFFATINDDELCTQETKDRIAKECGGIDSTTYRRECLCEFVVDSDLAIIPEWKDEYESEWEKDEFYKYYAKYVAQDIGVVDYTAHLYGYYDFKRARLVIEDETSINGPRTTTEAIAQMVKEKEKELWGEMKVKLRVSDRDNLILLNDLASMHNLAFLPTDKDELPAMINDVRLLVQAGRLIVHPRCKMLLGCLKYGIYNSAKFKREFARSKVYGHYDWLAALVYLVRNLDDKTNPIPKDLGLHFSSHHLHKQDLVTDEQKAWGQLVPKTFKSKGSANA